MIQIREGADRAAEPNGSGSDTSCEEFQARIPELIGGDIHSQQHLKTCERCTSLIAELQYIADIARELIPVYEPPDTVWMRIANSIHQTGEELPEQGGTSGSPSTYLNGKNSRL